MLSGHSLIYFSPERWEGMWRNRQQLMSIFARDNKVMFVEPRPYLRRVISRGASGAVDHPNRRDPTIRTVFDNLHVFRYPMWGVISGRTPLKQLGAMVRRHALRRALRELDMPNPIVWISRPEMQDVIDEIPAPAMIVYHVVDEYSAYHGTSDAARAYINAAEQRLLARADLVFVVSENLFKSKQPFNPNTHLVANGVDFRSYASALADRSLPPRLAAIKEPRLGYIGHISERLDWAALMSVATEHPEWSLVFVGEVRFGGPSDDWHRLTALPNVHYLGSVGVREVPHYVKGFQVGLMPYRMDQHSANVSPLKLYDYLAAGIPVVSSDISAAREFAQHIQLVPDGDYGAALNRALGSASAERRAERIELARAASWDHRAQRMSDIIEARLEKRRD